MRYGSEYFLDILVWVVVTFVVIFGYRYMLKRLQRGRPSQQYATLHTLTSESVNGEVRFFFELPEPGSIRFFIEDESENEIAVLADGDKDKGSYPIKWDTNQIPDGVYFYKLTTGNQTISKRLVVKNAA